MNVDIGDERLFAVISCPPGGKIAEANRCEVFRPSPPLFAFRSTTLVISYAISLADSTFRAYG
jgi:hypothetical protein